MCRSLTISEGASLARTAGNHGYGRQIASARARRRVGLMSEWPAVIASVASFSLLAFSCDRVSAQRSAITAWQRSDTVYFHVGIGVGPVLTTNADGSRREGRRYDPVGP